MKTSLPSLFTIFIILALTSLTNAQTIRDSTWHYEGYEAHPNWDLIGKTDYSYDTQARIVYQTRYSFETNPISFVKRINYSYDVNGRLSQIDEYIWNDPTGWSLRYQYFYEYDSNSYLTKDETWFYFSPGDINKYKLEYSYDSEGNLLYEAYLSHSPGWGYVPETESYFNYDANNNLLQERFLYDVYEDLTTYTYDSLNRQLSKLEQYYDYYVSANLINTSRETHFYTGDSINKDSLLLEGSDFSGTEWENLYLYKYNYNVSSLLEQSIRSKWEESLGIFDTTTRYSFMYDTNQNLTEALTESYNNNEWELYSKKSETFNNDNLSIEKYTNQTWDSNNSIWYGNDHQLRAYSNDNYLLEEELQVWSGAINEYENITKDVHFWSELIPTSLEDVKENTTCVLPNPYKLGESFSCEILDPNFVYSFNVHDLTGKKIYQRSFLGSQELKLQNNIPEGVYIFSINDKKGNNIYSNKVFVRY